MEKIPRDSESVRNLMQLKKTRLVCHLPFIRRMVEKLENTDLQVKWKTAYEGILSDKKLFSVDQINKLDATVIRLMKQQNERQTKETVGQEDESLAIQKAGDVGKPVLSEREVQELIEDLELSEKHTPQSNSPTRQSPLPLPSLVKTKPLKSLTQFKQKITLRRSSCFPLDIDKKRPKRPDSFLEDLIAQSSLKTPFKIPKVTPSPGASTSAPPKSILKPFDMFKSLNDKPAKTPPRRWSVACNKGVNKNDPMSPSIDKIKIVKSPSSSKSHEIVKVAKVESKREPGPSVVITYATGSTKTGEKLKEGKTAKAAKKEKSETPDDIEQSMDRLFSDESEPSTPVPAKKRRSSVSKISKELRRLQENIVKDDSPLPSRRSCAQKRISAGFRDSPVADDDEKPVTKRSKPSPKVEAKAAPKVEAKSIFGTRRKSRFEEKQPAPATVAKPVKEDPPRVGRATRRSAAAAGVVQADEVATKRPKRARQQSESSAESLTKDFPMKTCSVKLTDAVRSPEKANNAPVTPTRQVAMKSTNQRQEVAQIASKSPEAEKPQSPESKKEPPKPVTLIYKNICNIAFTKCRNGVIHKCLLQGCRYQTLEKQTFVKHLQVRHHTVNWNGYCNICLKTVLPGKDSHTLINEYVHMEEHLHEEKPSTAEIAIVKKSPTPAVGQILLKKSPTPESEVKAPKNSSKPKVDPELMKGLDSLLDVLCPKKESAKKFKPSQPRNPVFAEEIDTEPKLKPNPKFAIPCFPKPTPAAVPAIPNAPIAPQTKVISRNIIGRVIPMSQLPGLTGKIVFGKGFKVQLPANTFKIISPMNAVKIPTPASAATKLEPKVVQQVPPKAPQSEQAKVPSKPTLALTVPADSWKRLPAADLTNSKGVQCFSDEPEKWMLPQETPKPTDPLRFSEILRPWLGVKSKKNERSIQALTNRVALAATYKCMGKNCTFFSIDSQLFETHLSFHMRFTTDKNFLGCCYCSFEAEGVRVLIDHINLEHGCDAFQCAYCFYRSFVDFNVITHQNSYHVMRPRVIVRLNNPNKRDFTVELEKVKRNRVETVPPIFCVCRKASFYIFKAFLNHINSHSSQMTTTCAKCRQKTSRSTIHSHLVHCHGYGLYQCVYCRFGTNTREIISHHIANKHPSKMPFFCERNERNVAMDPINGNLTSKTFDPSSIESTCLKHIKQNVKPSFFVDAPDDEIAMRNYSNIGDLAQSIRVQGMIGRQLPGMLEKAELLDTPKTSPQVLSAHDVSSFGFVAKPQEKPKPVEEPDKTYPPIKAAAKPAKTYPPIKAAAKPVLNPMPGLSRSNTTLTPQQPSVKVRTTAELQQPIVKIKSLSELQTQAAEFGTSKAASFKKASIFKKKADAALFDCGWNEMLSHAKIPEPTPKANPAGRMPGLTPLAQRQSLTQGAPKQLLKGMLNPRSSLPALTSLTAGEILKKNDGSGTVIIKEEPSAEKEPAPPSFGLQIQNVFSLSGGKEFGESAWNTSDYED